MARSTATAGSPYKAGVKPSAIASDPVNRFVYVTDFASNQLIGYAIQSDGSLNFLVNGPFKTGNQPSSIVVDPRGIYIYVSNSLDSSITGYTIALPTGTPSAIVNTNSSLVYATDTQPVAITVDPALGRFVYTVNHLGNSVSGFRLNPNTGVVTAYAGHSLSNRRQSDRAGHRPPRQPLRAVGHSVTENTPSSKSPASAAGLLICRLSSDTTLLMRRVRGYFRPLASELKLKDPTPGVA